MGGIVLPAARGGIKELRKPAAAVTFEDREPMYLPSTRPARTGSDLGQTIGTRGGVSTSTTVCTEARMSIAAT